MSNSRVTIKVADCALPDVLGRLAARTDGLTSAPCSVDEVVLKQSRRRLRGIPTSAH